MTRPMTGAVRTRLSENEVQPIVLVEGAFDSGPVRLWTGPFELTWNGSPWVGVGDLLDLERIGETAEVRAPGIKVTLSGVASSTLSLALSEDFQGRTLTIWFGFLREETTVVPTPVIVFRGRMDTMNIVEAGESSVVEVTAENRLADLERANERRYTHEDQQIDFPDDRGLEFVASTKKPTFGEGWGRPGAPFAPEGPRMPP